MNISDEAIEAVAAVVDATERKGLPLGEPSWAHYIARAALEAAAPHMLEQATEDRELVEERVKVIVQEVAMTVDYTERLYTAVQEIMAVTMPKPTP